MNERAKAARARLFDALGYRLEDESLLIQALSHRSASGPNNERLEFLGDAVLDSVISHALYQRFPAADEGILSRLRASLVRDQALAEIARSLSLGDLVRLGSGELKSGGARRDSILSDAFEALLGAVFLHGSYSAVEQVILHVFADRLDSLAISDADKDAKTALQEWLQARALSLPVYTLIDAEGPDHSRVFTVKCVAQDLQVSMQATGSSRRLAEQRAARKVLSAIDGNTE